MWRSGIIVTAALTLACAAQDPASARDGSRLNPLIALHEAEMPIFGLYAPSAGGGRGRGGAAGPLVRSPEERAAETIGYARSDFVFDGSMEGGVDDALPAFAAFAESMREAGATGGTRPLVVKAPKIVDAEQIARDVGRQLDTGASVIMFVQVESAEEVRMGLDAMHYGERGGTRLDGVGSAPAYWGLSEEEYRRKADLWPLDPEGELISWVIVESEEGLENVREIAAVPGIGVLWPGAGTLRRIFSTTDEDGNRVLDEEGWENAIQTVLAACKEFEVPCGYPANADDIEMRMEQGFSVFVMGWGEGGFETVEKGRALAGR